MVGILHLIVVSSVEADGGNLTTHGGKFSQ